MTLDTLLKILGLLFPVLLVWINYLYRKKGELEQQVAGIKRTNYEQFFSTLENILDKGDSINIEELKKSFRDFAGKVILFGSPSTIRKFNRYLIFCSSEGAQKDTVGMFKHMGRLIKAMRADIGLSNSLLRYYEILQPFIKGDLKKELKELKKREK